MTTFTDWISIPRVNKSTSKSVRDGTSKVFACPKQGCIRLTGSDKMSGSSIAELMKDSVSVSLLHFCMNVVTGVSKFGNLLGKKFHTVDRVAEDNTLVDLKF